MIMFGKKQEKIKILLPGLPDGAETVDGKPPRREDRQVPVGEIRGKLFFNTKGGGMRPQKDSLGTESRRTYSDLFDSVNDERTD